MRRLDLEIGANFYGRKLLTFILKRTTFISRAMPSRNHLDKIGRRKKKKWSEEAMTHALMEVKSGKCTVRQAAKEFGVPKSSLGDRVSGRVTPGSRSGPAQLITSSDEELLVEFSSYMSEHGFPLTKRQLVSFASSIYKRQHRRVVAFSKLGQTWWLNFRKRQGKKITIQPADGVTRGRTLGVRKEALDHFFHLLSSAAEAHALADEPQRIWNCDELVFQLARKRALLPDAAGLACKSTPGSKDCTSVLACWNAAGTDLPPFIVYSKAYPGGARYKTQGPSDALYGWSDSGGVTSELFKKWFLRHFLPRAPQERPLLLIFDGHRSPVNLEVVEAARKEGVVLLSLPPRCAHVLQPLRAGFFPLIERRFAALVGDPRSADAAPFAVSKKDFSAVFKAAYQVAKEDEGIRIVREGFRKCGVYPPSRFPFDEAHLVPSSNADPPTGDTSARHVVGSFTAPGL